MRIHEGDLLMVGGLAWMLLIPFALPYFPTVDGHHPWTLPLLGIVVFWLGAISRFAPNLPKSQKTDKLPEQLDG